MAAVWGQLRERHPKHSVYHRLFEAEWNYDMPFGEVSTISGIAMLRARALREVGGYDPARIAGEERDLALRLLRKKWALHRVDVEMTTHDAAMTRFSQWWKRSERAGHAFAELAYVYGREAAEGRRSCWSIVGWGLLLPLTILLLAVPTAGGSLLLALLYPLQIYRVYRHTRQRSFTCEASLVYASFVVLGRFPSLIGLARFHGNRLRGRRAGLIEYK